MRLVGLAEDRWGELGNTTKYLEARRGLHWSNTVALDLDEVYLQAEATTAIQWHSQTLSQRQPMTLQLVVQYSKSWGATLAGNQLGHSRSVAPTLALGDRVQ